MTGSPPISPVLDEILATKRAEVALLSRSRARAKTTYARRDIVERLSRRRGEPLRLITENKRRSPSSGALSIVLSVAERVIAYGRNGASVISVLCDAKFFGGSFAHLAAARTALDEAKLDVPLLAKEFIVDGRQLEEAAACGADSALLIARIVSAEQLRELTSHARALGLEPLVEIVTEDELSAALEADAKVIGVNARDLDTLAMDPARAARVLAAIPDDRVAVHLSGLKGPDDVRAVAGTDVDGALIGEALMREDDPSALLRALVLAGA